MTLPYNFANGDIAPSERLLVRKHTRQQVDNPSNKAATDDTAPSERSQIRKHARQQVDNPLNKSALTAPTLGELGRLARKAQASHHDPDPAPVNDAPERSLRRRLPPEVISEMVKRYNAGEFTTDLSQEYGISKSGLLKLLRDEGVKLRKQPITPEDEQRVVKLYESGLTIKRVEERVGYSYGTIRRVLHENGGNVRPSAIRRRSK